MMTLDRVDPSGARVSRTLGLAPWLVLLVVAVLAVAATDVASAGRFQLGAAVALVLLLVGRLVRVGARTTERRRPLTLLAAGLTLWSGADVLTGVARTLDVDLPAGLDEGVRAAGAAVLAAFVLTDASRRLITSPAVRLEVIVVWVGVCLVVFAATTAVPGGFIPAGDARVTDVLSHLGDVALVSLVLSRAVLRQRDRSVRTGVLLLGFVALMVADSDIVTGSSRTPSTVGLLVVLIGGAGLAAIVGAACATPPPAAATPLPRQTPRAVPVAAAVAVVALVGDPTGAPGWTMRLLALVTLVATGARLTLALRDAQGAAEATRLSLTDDLTGLPNRRALLAAADDALRTTSPIGVLLLDLDGFKDVNDSLGHTIGDEVLVALAQRMRAATDHRVMVARLGGDEFALLISSVNREHLLETAQRVRASLRELLRVESFDLSIDASVGITMREQSETSSTELLRRADIAMYAAKSAHAGVVFFDPAQDGFSRQRLRRQEELREALAEGQLVVWYQPQIDARTRAVVAMEALIRWWHPTEGLLAPVAFLADVRRAGLMPALTELVMRRVVDDARRWRSEGLTFRVAMNCAPPELVSGELLPQLFAALAAADLPADSILVEVTEDSFLADPERTRDALHELHSHHVQVSVDDYGTGFSSLAYLRDLPVQELKLDRSFIAPVVHDERSRMIVRTTSEMARALGLRLVAEGVESPEVAAALLPLGVDVFQGYCVARPMPADDVSAWTRRWTAEHRLARGHGRTAHGGGFTIPAARSRVSPADASRSNRDESAR